MANAYHHGNLRRALLDEAAALIAEQGPDAVTLRGLAARAGVSHAAPAHHFGDRAGLFTALAAEGFELLADVAEAARRDGDFLEVGLAYVRFAVDHAGHFQLMFQPSFFRADDDSVRQPQERLMAACTASAAEATSAEAAADVGLAGWCLMHGLATLWLSGNLAEPQDAVALARRIGGAWAGAFSAPC